MINHDIAVIGGGPAGMAAAVAAYDSGVTDVCILEREEMLGGILKQCIHNGFGLHKLGRELTGPEYAAVYAEKVKERGIKAYCETMVTGISPDKTVTAQSTAGLLKIKAKAVILAMGCRERSRGALNTAGTRPAGTANGANRPAGRFRHSTESSFRPPSSQTTRTVRVPSIPMSMNFTA